MGRKKKEDEGPKTNFTLPANVIQANAQKESIKKLNQEFQMAGGMVSFKTTKKGQSVQLSHSDPNYLENFRLRLFHEMGLSTTSEDGAAEAASTSAPPPPSAILPLGARQPYSTPRPPTASIPPQSQPSPAPNGANPGSGAASAPSSQSSPQTGPGPPPRNIEPLAQLPWQRGPQKPGYYPRGHDSTPRGPPMSPRPHFDSSSRPKPSHDGGYQKRSGPRPSGPVQARHPQVYHRPREETAREVEEIMTAALKGGVIDDGQIIKYAFMHGIKEEVIEDLRKRLISGSCNSVDKRCPYKRKQMRFEEVMKSCCGVKAKCNGLESDLCHFFDQWHKNVETLYSEFKDKDVVVIGKISSAKYIERDSEKNHYKLLIYDTLVRHKKDASDLSKKPKDTRKLWAKIEEEEFNRLNRSESFKINDVVKLEGTVVWNEHFFDYWIVNITEMKVLEKKGDMPIKP